MTMDPVILLGIFVESGFAIDTIVQVAQRPMLR
jgi:hypothetical protein